MHHQVEKRYTVWLARTELRYKASGAAATTTRSERTMAAKETDLLEEMDLSSVECLNQVQPVPHPHYSINVFLMECGTFDTTLPKKKRVLRPLLRADAS